MEDLLAYKIHMVSVEWSGTVGTIDSVHMLMDLGVLEVAQGGEENVFDLVFHRQREQSFHTLSYLGAGKVCR